jgi:hypothetical protein
MAEKPETEQTASASNKKNKYIALTVKYKTNLNLFSTGK